MGHARYHPHVNGAFLMLHTALTGDNSPFNSIQRTENSDEQVAQHWCKSTLPDGRGNRVPLSLFGTLPNLGTQAPTTSRFKMVKFWSEISVRNFFEIVIFADFLNPNFGHKNDDFESRCRCLSARICQCLCPHLGFRWCSLDWEWF